MRDSSKVQVERLIQETKVCVMIQSSTKQWITHNPISNMNNIRKEELSTWVSQAHKRISHHFHYHSTHQELSNSLNNINHSSQ
jgi:hypothetical protein